MAVVIATPLRSDEYSQRRLLDKLEIYLKLIGSQEFQSEAGLPSPENTIITVHIHPSSDAAVFDLLHKCEPWIVAGNAKLHVKLLDQGSH